MDSTWKFFAAAGGAIASFLFGGWSALLQVLLGFVVLDYVSGMTAAAIEGTTGKGPGLSSAVGLRGIAKKVFIFAMVAVAHMVDRVLGEAHLLRDATTFFYLSNELLSIIENIGRIGVPIPPVIKQAVQLLKGKGEAKR